jgi:ABC-type transporter MlaC component
MRKRTLLMMAVLIVAAASALVAAAGSAAADGPEVIRRGGCTGASDWKLKLKPEDGGIEVEFEVDQNRNGKKWRVVLRHNGAKFFNRIRKTQPPSGSFEVRRVVANKPGADTIRARARNLRSREVCRGRATF